MIPKTGGALRRLGDSDRDRSGGPGIVEVGVGADLRGGFLPCSYGFRPKRRAHDAVAEVRYLATRPRCYDWVVEGDIKACFDEIDHTALMGRVRRRVGDNRVLGLVKAFLKAGILTEGLAWLADSTAGTPQGGILRRCWPMWRCRCSMNTSPGCRVVRLPARLSAPDDFVTGSRTFWLVRYADDWCSRCGAPEPTPKHYRRTSPPCWRRWGCVWHRTRPITHIDEGLDFLGWRIQRRRKRGTSCSYVCVHPSTKAVLAVKRKIKTLRRAVELNQPS